MKIIGMKISSDLLSVQVGMKLAENRTMGSQVDPDYTNYNREPGRPISPWTDEDQHRPGAW